MQVLGVTKERAPIPLMPDAYGMSRDDLTQMPSYYVKAYMPYSAFQRFLQDEHVKNTYGENFFETTRPVLVVYNETMNYSFEVDINDFANSWYFNINDSKSNYRIELGRRPIENISNIKANYIYITSSNKIESPNDHILFNNSQKMVYFRNVKTGQVIEKTMANLYFMRNMGKIYNIYDLYKELYKNEDNLENLSNPSS